MTEPKPEILVVLAAACDRPPALEVLASLRGFGPVAGRLDPRLVLLAAPAGIAAEIARTRGVVGAFTDDPPPRLRETFTDNERLFVDAWLRRGAQEPPPPGDGLPWDTPGWLPPDLPPPHHTDRKSA